jgi:parvulin-like peptidyl-prolyl isomerase
VQPSKKFTLRLAIYSVALLYVAADLFLFDGPLRTRVAALRSDSPDARAAARKLGIVAKVMGRPIYLSQVDRAARERLWLRGRTLDELDPAQRRAERMAALNALIDHEILRTKVLHNMDRFPVDEAAVDEAVRLYAGRFASRQEMQELLAAEGIDSEKELRYRLAARLQQHQYVESQIAEHLDISEDEARAWFEARRHEFEIPPRIRARHVFLATLDRPAAEAEVRLQKALRQLEAGTRSFAELAAQLSEDPRSRDRGGDLGWMTRDRLPPDFAAAAFALEPGQPALVRTRIGWHLLEITASLPAEVPDFSAARAEVRAAMESARRIEVVRNLRRALRQTEGVGVHIDAAAIPGE